MTTLLSHRPWQHGRISRHRLGPGPWRRWRGGLAILAISALSAGLVGSAIFMPATQPGSASAAQAPPQARGVAISSAEYWRIHDAALVGELPVDAADVPGLCPRGDAACAAVAAARPATRPSAR